MAVLKLVEQGKITFDTPVGDYLPEFRNSIVVDNALTPETGFKPAETVVTLKHLLNFTSGLFYPVVIAGSRSKMDEAYTSKQMHRAEDPASEFFRIVKVGIVSDSFFFKKKIIILLGRSSRFAVEI